MKCQFCKSKRGQRIYVNTVEHEDGEHEGEVFKMCTDCRRNKLVLHEASGYWLRPPVHR